MVAIGFTVCREEILSGAKRTTIRPDSKKWQFVLKHYMINEPILLQLYWHLRRPDCELLKEPLLHTMIKIKLKDLTEKQAREDGFPNLGVALLWFKLTYPKTWYNAYFWIIGW